MAKRKGEGRFAMEGDESGRLENEKLKIENARATTETGAKQSEKLAQLCEEQENSRENNAGRG